MFFELVSQYNIARLIAKQERKYCYILDGVTVFLNQDTAYSLNIQLLLLN